MAEQRKRRQILLQQVQDLLQELADLDINDDEEQAPPLEHGPGVRVRVTRRDKYHGRVGTITGRHGLKFWNVRLDPLPHEARGREIFKMPQYLAIIR